jgi:hypothetical protein
MRVFDRRSRLGGQALASLKALTIPVIKGPFAGRVAMGLHMLLMALANKGVDGDVAIRKVVFAITPAEKAIRIRCEFSAADQLTLE